MAPPRLKLSGILFLLAGVAFVAAFLLGRQVANIGVAVAFFCLGVARLVKARAATGDKS